MNQTTLLGIRFPTVGNLTLTQSGRSGPFDRDRIVDYFWIELSFK